MDSIWLDITRLGESGFLLPIGALLPVWFLLTRRVALALIWILIFGLGVGLVVLSKVLFFGWGIGVRSVDFTGVSGHTMLAAAVFPTLAFLVLSPRHKKVRVLAVGLAILLSLGVALSRVQLAAHSVSEVVVGFVLGAAVAAAFVGLAMRQAPARIPGVLVAVSLLASGFAGIGHYAPSHRLIVDMALRASGHQHAYRRDQWLAHPDEVQT